MRFTLVYDGELPASGNKSKPKPVWNIRNQIAPQLEELWSTHRILKDLTTSAYRPKVPGQYQWSHHIPGPEDPHFVAPADWEQCCAPIPVEQHAYVPLVRKSLNLVCGLNILFLRREEPGSLIFQGGDLDNRIKTLLDGLRVPNPGEHKGGSPTKENLHCLLESDTLISDLQIKTDRYLCATSDHPHAVRLVIEVNTRLLEVDPITVGLMAD